MTIKSPDNNILVTEITFVVKANTATLNFT